MDRETRQRSIAELDELLAQLASAAVQVEVLTRQIETVKARVSRGLTLVPA